MTATVSESKRERVGLRILVVDDNVDAADTLARLLQAWGHEACAVYSGADALGVLATVQPEVIFSDLAMPTMDGMAFNAKTTCKRCATWASLEARCRSTRLRRDPVGSAHPTGLLVHLTGSISLCRNGRRQRLALCPGHQGRRAKPKLWRCGQKC